MRHSFKVVALVGFMACGDASAAAPDKAEWPSLRGPNHDGSAAVGSRLAGAEGARLAVVWRAALGAGYSSVAVAGGRAVTLFSDGKSDTAIAFDAATGREIWRQPIAPMYKGHDGSFDGPVATPAVADGRVFALGPRGDLVALSLASGKTIWRAGLTEIRAGEPPFYGYGSSPLVLGNVLVVQVGADKGRAIAGFDVATGERKWTLGEDGINYQTPVVLRVGGRDQVVAAGDAKLFGIDPAAGRLLWEHVHGGEPAPMAALTMVPVPAGDGRLFVKNRNDTSTLFRIAAKEDGGFSVEPLWKSGVLRQSYSIPVYHDGHLYGFNGRILSCVDAATGEVRWRSREPGDGFLAVVGGDLMIVTKASTLHVGAASPAGWHERQQMELFKDLVWSPPSFAMGALFARSQGEIARVELRAGTPASDKSAAVSLLPPSSRFAKFLAEVEKAKDKTAAVDRFLAGVPSFPLVEADHAVFLYRGASEDVAIAGDMIGSRREDPMIRVPGTDLSWYAARLEPDALISYHFQVNFDERVPDPKNPRKVAGPAGPGNPKEMSFFGMPKWSEPSHLAEPEPARRGRLEPHEVQGQGVKAKVHVHVPAGYDGSAERYPVAYVLDGDEARAIGRIPETLDNLFGRTLPPLLAVFVSRPDWGEARPKDPDAATVAEAAFLARDIVSFVDARYRTTADPAARAVVGHGRAGFPAAFAAFSEPGVFGALGTQSLFMLDGHESLLKKHMRTNADQPLRLYLDWGLYDMRGTREAWDNVKMNRSFDAFLRERGYQPAGGEGHEGFGWVSWRNRTDRLLATLFPKSR